MNASFRSRPSVFLAAVFLAGCGLNPTVKPSTDAGTAMRWSADVAAIAAADQNAGRRDAIEQSLVALHMPATRTPFASGEHDGVNLFAHVSGGSDSPLLLLGAHSDKVEAGRGATDNASGSAVVLALASRFKHRPLRHHRIGVAFWDLEEKGLLGASAYIAQGREKPALYVNFDVFGWGDALWMMTTEATHPLALASRDAADERGIVLSAGKRYPPTDHDAFLKSGWPAVSFSLVDRAEIPRILQAFDGKDPHPPAKVMSVIHSDRDTVAELEPEDVVRGIDVVEEALRRWDAATAE